MGDFLIWEQADGVVTLTMNRPDQRNTLSGEGQHEDFIKACGRIEADETVRCVILTGAGSAFSAGGNVKDMRDRKGLSAGTPYEIRNNYRRGIQRIPLSLYNLDVPTIAAVNGPAIGAGCDLATMCDIRIASDRAKFAESFVRLGIIPGDGGAWLLPRIVGLSKAAELAFTGDTIDAAEALACGLASKVVPHDSLMDEARALAGRIARNPAHALRMTKKLLREAQFSRLETLLEMSAAFQALAHHDPAHDAAVAALIAQLEKRKP
jgi:enoyl-CoA hydratase/carnithine racemase